MTSAPGIRFEYRPTRLPSILAGAGLALAIFSFLFAALPWSIRLVAVAVLIALTGGRLVRPVVSAVRQVAWSPQGEWRVWLADGREETAQLVAYRLLGEHVLLSLHANQSLQLWLTANTVPADTLRRLRVRLIGLRGKPDDPRA